MPAAHISDNQFEEVVLKSEKPVMVDFFAEWCGPCKAAAPVLDELADEYKDKVNIVKVDVDQSELAGNYGVMSIPTVIVFKGGKAVGNLRQVGFPGRDGYKSMLEEALK